MHVPRCLASCSNLAVAFSVGTFRKSQHTRASPSSLPSPLDFSDGFGWQRAGGRLTSLMVDELRALLKKAQVKVFGNGEQP